MTAFSRRAGFSWLLAISLSFNLAFLAGYAVTKHRASRAPATTMGPGSGASEGLCARMGVCGRRMEGKVKALEEQLMRERKALADLLSAESVERPRLEERVAAIAAIQAQVQMAVLETLIEERGRLGPDRRADFDAMLRTCMHGTGGTSPCGGMP